MTADFVRSLKREFKGTVDRGYLLLISLCSRENICSLVMLIMSRDSAPYIFTKINRAYAQFNCNLIYSKDAQQSTIIQDKPAFLFSSAYANRGAAGRHSEIIAFLTMHYSLIISYASLTGDLKPLQYLSTGYPLSSMNCRNVIYM